MWDMRIEKYRKFEKKMVIEFVGKKRVIKLNGEEVEENEIKGFV
jgi:hypothetical protein